jgi:hypothetical protein
LKSFLSSAPRNARKDHANEDDQDSDLNPDEPAELSENDFDAITPGESIALPTASMPSVAVRSPHLARRIGGISSGDNDRRA